MPVPAPVSAYGPEMAVTKMNKKTDRAKEITRCKDRDVGLLSWDSDTAGEPSTALAVTSGGLWGHPSHSWVTQAESIISKWHCALLFQSWAAVVVQRS